MSSGPENRFIQAVHRLLPCRVYRMKNHNPYVGGVADCWYSGDAGDLWVEYKFLSLPKRSSTIVNLYGADKSPLSTLQEEWLRGRHREGRNVGVIIGTPDGGLWLPGVTWEKPLSSAECASRLLSKTRVAEVITNAVCLTSTPPGLSVARMPEISAQPQIRKSNS